MANVRVSERQNLLDVAIQESGSILAAFDLAVANDISVTDDLTAGQVLQTVDIYNADVFNYYTQKNLKPATGFSSFGTPGETEEEGISIWAINIDFIVQ